MEDKNQYGQTMEQANDPKNWVRGVYTPETDGVNVATPAQQQAANANPASTSVPFYQIDASGKAIIGADGKPITQYGNAGSLQGGAVEASMYKEPTSSVGSISSDFADSRKAMDTEYIQQMQESDAIQAENLKNMLENSTAGVEADYARREQIAKETYTEQEGTQRVLQTRLGTAGTAYGTAEIAKSNAAKQRYFDALASEKASKIQELKQAYIDNDLKRANALRDSIYQINTQQTNFLQQERQNQLQESKDIMEKAKPVEVGGYMYKYNDQTGQYDKIGNATGGASTETTDVKNYEYYASQEYALGKEPKTFDEWYAVQGSSATANKPVEIGTDSMGNKIYGVYNAETKIFEPVANPSASTPITSENLPEYNQFMADKSTQSKELFSGLDDVTKANVMSLLTGESLLSDIAKGMGGAKAAQNYNALAQQIDPSYSETSNKQRYAFKNQWNNTNGKAYQVRAGVNTGLNHLARLKELTDQLTENTSFKKANSIKQWISKNINGPDAAIIAQFQDTVALLATEIARVYKGGVPDQNEVTQQVESINSIAPNNILTAIINNKANLMTGKIVSESEEYKKVMGSYPTEIVNQDTIDALKAAGVDTKALEEKVKKISPAKPVEFSSDWDSYFEGL